MATSFTDESSKCKINEYPKNKYAFLLHVQNTKPYIVVLIIVYNSFGECFNIE